ncbi:hypothetical protein ABB37_03380 [Leptomonas pyrrhocoris]|uniref:Uncharacterized protein n=1 Tax=Leptomonas pyrrhocoris TaxID=157538 RepID=A0A0N0DWX2_LEPPY|nr:hypothetical protein ABB37_03380 [Leptomonas pyrrhocoris]KPA82272.1 hypothetical protein ABB37_03380 [Leptomonas pyrrhocoris]|eukprot:XP_015660711.1 hypothetical protein ABB37_03380 [Leptomonas pyrrhocoris]
MTGTATLLQWFSFFSLATLQLPYLPFFKDVAVLVCMSGALLFVVTLVLVYVVADKEMHLYLTKATRAALPQGVAVKGNQVAVPTSYEAFVSASITMSVVGTLAVLLSVSFVVQLACDGMQACVSPMVALTLNTVKPKCWDGAEDFRGKVAPSPEPDA